MILRDFFVAALFLIGALPSHAVIVGSLFDPDSQTIQNGGAATSWGATTVVNIDTSALSITVTGQGAFSGTGNLGMTEGASLLGSQDVALFAFSDLSIGSGTTFNLTGDRPLYFLSQTDLFLGATLDGSPSSRLAPRLGGFAGAPTQLGGEGPGGGAAGRGGASSSPPAGGGGHAQVGGGRQGGPSYGDDAISDIVGGSGGGGNVGFSFVEGGSGGGAIALIAQSELRVAGAIDVSGADAQLEGSHPAGSGSGGSILLAGPTVVLEAGSSLDVSGGTEGGIGSGGRIAIYSNNDFTNDGTMIGIGGVEGGTFATINSGFPSALSAVPEPSTVAFCVLAFGCFLRRQRRYCCVK